MNTRHHPDEATIVAYASGTLDEGFAVVVSCHLEVCAECRSRLRTAEALGGAMMCDETETVAVSDGAFGRLLEKMSVERDATSGSGGDKREDGAAPQADWNVKPRALRDYLDGNLLDIKWKRVGPGIWQKPIRLSQTAESSLRLLRIAPGKSVPEHGHGGQEITLILSGAYEDEIGYFGAGDVADLGDEIEHQPIVVSNEDCICLAATEAPTRFKSIFGRLLQPWVGI